MTSRNVAGSLALTADWDLGEDNWKAGMDSNLLKLSALCQAVALDTVSTTPGSPTEGDVYIFDETHGTHANAVAVYDEAAWVYFDPEPGWMVYDVAAAVLKQFSGTEWTEFTSGGGGGGQSAQPWELLDTVVVSSPASAFNFTGLDLDLYDEILIIGRQLTLSTSSLIYYHVSVDGGSSYYSSSGNYIVLETTGVETATTGVSNNNTNHTAARTGFIHLVGNQAGTPKLIYNSQQPKLFVASNSKVNAIRAAALAGNISGGTFYVLGRGRMADAGPNAFPNVQTEAGNYVVDPLDAGKYIRLTSASTKTVTVDPDSTTALPDNGEWYFRNVGAGDATIVEGSGVNVTPPTGGSLVIPAGGTVTLKRVGVDDFDLTGQTI